MGLPLVRIQPGMDSQMMASVINDNFAMLENLNRTQMFRDENGTNRIILGRLPDGTYGLVISKPGINVLNLFT